LRLLPSTSRQRHLSALSWNVWNRAIDPHFRLVRSIRTHVRMGPGWNRGDDAP
jgi:hypothetical protein